jgi:hypothetical protein
MRLLTVVSLVLIGLPGFAAERLLVDAAAQLTYWQVNLGTEFPGASGELSAANDTERGACLRGSFAFTADSRYAGFQWRGSLAAAKAVEFSVKMPRGDGGIRVLDSTGQWLMGSFKATRGQWSEVEVPLTPAVFGAHWSGANDGVIHFPLQAILIATMPGPATQEVLLKNLRVAVDEVPPGGGWQTVVKPGLPFGIALVGESVRYEIRCQNLLERPQSGRLTLQAQGVGEEPRQIAQWPLAAGPWEAQSFSFDLPSDTPRYVQLKAVLTDDSGATVQSTTSALAVLPRPRHMGEAAPDCYFGLQGGGDAAVAERLGAKALRLFFFWRFTEGKRGDVRWDVLDRFVRGAQEHKMAAMVTMDLRAPAWAGWNLEGFPNAKGLPAPEMMDEWKRFVGQTVDRVGDKLRLIEIENEPDLTCVSHAGLSLEQGADYYTNILRESRKVIREKAPGLTVAALDVSGGDLDRGLPFTRRVMDQAADCVDLYTGHPYASPRNFGPGQHPKWPVANRMAEKCTEALDLMEAHGRPRRMWVGELGWALSTQCDPLSREGLDWAACVAQSMIVGKSVPGVEKYMHFTISGCNEGGYEYGICRGDPAYPMPLALAYSTAAYVLDDTRPVERVKVGRGLWRASFVCEARNELIVAWWADEDGLAAQPPADAPAGRWVDSFQQPVKPKQGRFPVGRMPVYWVQSLADGPSPQWLAATREVHAWDLALGSAYVSAADRVTVELANYSGVAMPVTVDVSGEAQQVSLAPSEDLQSVQVQLKKALPVGYRRILDVMATGAGRTLRQELRTDLLALPTPPAGWACDGDLREWQTLKALDVSTHASVLPPDPNVGWDGPEDLSLKTWLAADARGLYLACAVTDDKHFVPDATAGRFWTSDSLQVAVDPRNNSTDAFDADDRELGLVLGADGPHVYLTVPGPGRSLEVPVAIRREGTVTTYEAFLPWSALDVPVPARGQVLAINFIANDNDGNGRNYWMGLTPGIGESKLPAAYREFVANP